MNDNEPHLFLTIVRCQAYNSLPNSVPLCHLIAYDLDDAGNEQSRSPSSVRFNITEGNDNGYFRISERTGEIYFHRKGGHDVPKNIYELTVSSATLV